MNQTIRFGKEDIGGELLPILTSGLYRDKLDTLREYIQNAIDAEASHIELVIDPDVVSVSDNGVGMTTEQARSSIRLGISEKNPIENVGFRGIGVYSAFNLCDQLDVFTRAAEETSGHIIRFDFQRMRVALLEEAERRRRGLAPSLYLERLLQETVTVEADASDRTVQHGTVAVLRGLMQDVYERLNNWEQVTDYLENVVPLPFHPDFTYKTQVEAKFEAEDYRVVPLALQIGSRREEIFRPYRNEIFVYGGKYAPHFFDVVSDGHKLGFAWVCINDARKVLKDGNLRGILIKKKGFSISNRSFLEPYFGRTVFSRRITGELIVQHDGLIPNAARSDFEHNATRQLFFHRALPRLIGQISEWANRIQEDEKAREILAEKSSRLGEINRQLPTTQRDREQLLLLNIELAQIERELRGHTKTLKVIELDRLTETEVLLKECQHTVHQALVENRQTRRKLEERVSRSVQREALQPSEVEKQRLGNLPGNLLDLLDAYGLLEGPEIRRVLQILDEEVLQPLLDENSYRQMLRQLRESLEESS